VSQTITSPLPVSPPATVRAATGASDGPERTDQSGLSISSRIGTTPPAELAASSSPAKPSAASPLAISGRWRCINGFNEASIDVPEARRYSRTIGFVRCESEYGRPGSSRSISAPSASSCDGLAVDHSRQTETASAPSSAARASCASAAGSSSATRTSPAASIRSVISSVSRRGTYGAGNWRL
jgi:hypothetical protein